MIFSNSFVNKYFKYLLILVCLQISINNIICEPKRVKFNQILINANRDGFTLIKNNDDYDYDPMQRILVAVIVKNHEYSLPTFLGTLETLKCPNSMNKCDLW